MALVLRIIKNDRGLLRSSGRKILIYAGVKEGIVLQPIDIKS
jgi:hypothetical protein